MNKKVILIIGLMTIATLVYLPVVYAASSSSSASATSSNGRTSIAISESYSSGSGSSTSNSNANSANGGTAISESKSTAKNGEVIISVSNSTSSTPNEVVKITTVDGVTNITVQNRTFIPINYKINKPIDNQTYPSTPILSKRPTTSVSFPEFIVNMILNFFNL